MRIVFPVLSLLCLASVHGLVHPSRMLRKASISRSTIGNQEPDFGIVDGVPDTLEKTDETWTKFYKDIGLRAEETDKFGFTKSAENWNGRLAMFGCLAVVIREINGGESMPVMLAQCVNNIETFGGLVS
mmetsp:Transcript_795/g.1012  ORF Transcript_795/g.1012 Transcript_795/m.1012 type:complete len:129 (-) Transcript_795:299-685(-)|eukprot:CAMPEP_0185768724 /NCGR_PEP_ID=MMETSP1174-20130828/51672_1 /TAXON_ID=35687 /ORGANISM="Dictyocha speculum, Strain CCMP1381" /LENGTH=128 /DNA_ID=CAMNT_0028453543 /DNA_START=83 /DNA_END=469 /DNA_ORIENTATION=+